MTDTSKTREKYIQEEARKLNQKYVALRKEMLAGTSFHVHQLNGDHERVRAWARETLALVDQRLNEKYNQMLHARPGEEYVHPDIHLLASLRAAVMIKVGGIVARHYHHHQAGVEHRGLDWVFEEDSSLSQRTNFFYATARDILHSQPAATKQ